VDSAGNMVVNGYDLFESADVLADGEDGLLEVMGKSLWSISLSIGILVHIVAPLSQMLFGWKKTN